MPRFAIGVLRSTIPTPVTILGWAFPRIWVHVCGALLRTLTYFTSDQKFDTYMYRGASLRWSTPGSMIQDHLDLCASKEAMNPCPEWTHQILWCIMARVILDHKSWSWSSQRNAPYVYSSGQILPGNCFGLHKHFNVRLRYYPASNSLTFWSISCKMAKQISAKLWSIPD